MKIIKLYMGEMLAGEGAATSEEDLIPALKMVTKAIQGIKGTRIEIVEGSLEELVNDFRGRFETVYTVAGNYKLGTSNAEISVEVKAVSREEAIEKARKLGIENPYIAEYDDEYEDDEYDEYEDDEYDDEEEDDDDECCCGHSHTYCAPHHGSTEDHSPETGQTIEINDKWKEKY